MIRVGIITEYHENINYGGLLQAYALQKTVEGFGMRCEIIDYIHGKHEEKDESYINKFIRYFLVDPNSAVELAYVKISTKINGKLLLFDKQKRTLINSLKQRIECDKFRKQIPHSDVVYDENTIVNTLNKYDIFIVGSDQVWNPFGITKIELLSFVTKEKKKVAYAASVSTHVFDQISRKLFAQYLSEFDCISVRESTSVKALEQFTLKKIKNVLDPVFLPGMKFWEDFLEEYNECSDYIFAYFLGTSNKNKKILESIRRKSGKTIIYLPLKENTRNNRYDEIGDVQLFNVSPAQFLGLIKNADMIVTDSFHGTAFSIIFNKQFMNLMRFRNSSKRNTNSRLVDLLNNFGLKERIVFEVDEIEPLFNNKIDYFEINNTLETLMNDSRNYLYNSLG